MTASSERRLERRKRLLLGGGLLGLVTLLCYLPALRAGFVWDDDSMLTNNPFVKLPAGLYYIWASSALPDYFPLTSTSFWLEWRVWGANAMGYHLTNVLLHAASAILLWRVLLRLAVPGAWLAALVFAVHPINVQSVAWIAERKNTLCMFFFLLSALWYLRFDSELRTSHLGLRNSKWYWLSLLAFLCALLSKTAVVMLPPVLLLYHWWQRNGSHSTVTQFNSSTIRRRPSSPAPSSIHHPASAIHILLRLTPFFALSLLLGLVTVWFQTHRAIGGDPIRDADFLTRLAGAGQAVWFYLWKTLLPLDLSFVYRQWMIDAGSPVAFLPLLGLLLAFGLFWFFRRSWGRPLLFAFGWFVLLLLPILGFVNIYFHRYALVADHWTYFASISLVALGVGTGTCLFNRFRRQSVAWLLPAAAVAAVVWMAAATWRQTRIYQDIGTLWSDTLSKNPACWLAHNSLGSALAGAGRLEDARAYYAHGLTIKPDSLELLNNLASVLLDQGKPDEGLAYLQKAIQIAPRSGMAHYNLGNAYDQQGRVEEALASYRRAIELDPSHAEAHSNLGCLLHAAGKTQEALDEFSRAITLKPRYPEALNNLGVIFMEMGSATQAESLLREAVRHKANYVDGHFNLGNALLRQGRVKEAAAAYRRALELNPRLPLARCRLGTALWHGGDAQAALAELKTALDLQPDLAEAHYQTGIILAGQQQAAAAISSLRRALQLRPDWPEALAGLAFTLATAPDAKERNGVEALELSKRAVELTRSTNFIALDALAAAQAEAASFAEAARTAGTAAQLARTAGDTNRAEQIQLRQKLYESGKPHRE